MKLYVPTGNIGYAATSAADLSTLLTALASPNDGDNPNTIQEITDRIQPLVQSDSGEPLELYFYDDASTVSSWVTDAAVTLAVGLGYQDPTTGFLFASTTSFTISGNARLGTLALNTTGLRDAVAQAQRQYAAFQQAQFTLHLRKTEGGITKTVGLVPVTVTAGVLNAAPETQTGLSYVEAAAFAIGAVHPMPAITSLTGGGTTALDGIDDSNLPTGYTVKLSFGRIGRDWQIFATTDATDVANGVVRVKTYSATNARAWIQL